MYTCHCMFVRDPDLRSYHISNNTQLPLGLASIETGDTVYTQHTLQFGITIKGLCVVFMCYISSAITDLELPHAGCMHMWENFISV